MPRTNPAIPSPISHAQIHGVKENPHVIGSTPFAPPKYPQKRSCGAVHNAIAVKRERKRSGRHAAATQLIKRQIAKAGKFAKKNTASIKSKLYRKLISCDINTGTMLKIPISRPKTRICQGYSNMLTTVLSDWPKCQNLGAVTAPRLNDQNEPVNIFDQKRQLTPKAITASSQHL